MSAPFPIFTTPTTKAADAAQRNTPNPDEPQQQACQLEKDLKKPNFSGYAVVPIVGRRAEIWAKFGQVVTASNDLVTTIVNDRKYFYVVCLKCQLVLPTYTSEGTNPLQRHECRVAKPSSSKGISGILTPVPAARHERERVLEAMVQFCTIDLRPFKVVDGMGFQNLIQSVLDIGYNSSRRIVATSLLPDRKTIRRSVVSHATDRRGSLRECLEQHLVDGGYVGMTTDIWTEPMKTVSFISVSCSWINKDWKLIDQVLCVREVDAVSHTAANVLMQIQSILTQYGLTQPERVVFVTDEGSNMSGQLGIGSIYSRLACLDHRINTVVTTILQKTTTQKKGKTSKRFYRYYEQIQGVCDLVDASKSLVKWFKKANKQTLLDTSLKQEVKTRWNSLLRCLESVEKNFDLIVRICREAKQSNLYENKIDQGELQKLIAFLKPFDEATLDLETSKAPSINLAVFWYNTLLQHCSPSPDDSPDIANLRKLVLVEIKAKYVLDDLHKVGMYLDPTHQQSAVAQGWMTQVEMTRLEEVVTTMMLDEFMTPVAMPPAPLRRVEATLSRKRSRGAMYAKLRESAVNAPVALDRTQLLVQELITYKTLVVTEEAEDLLSWWKHQTHLPNLQRLARRVLAVPASSAKSESNFSDAGVTITKLRNSLKPSIVDDILFVRSSYKVE